MNIIINNKCNLSCDYCFAKSYTKEGVSTFMPFTTFKYIVDWCDKNGQPISILGGEPTFHPYLIEFIEYVLTKSNIPVLTLLTNGVFDNKIARMLIKIGKHNKKFTILLNYNSKEDIHQNSIKVKSNVTTLITSGVKVILGYNIYKPEQDYLDFLTFCKQLNISEVRIAFAVPSENRNYEEYTTELNKVFTNFYIQCDRLEIVPVQDCNLYPICKMGTELSQLYLKFNVVKPQHCSNCLYVDETMNIYRCLGGATKKGKMISIKENFNIGIREVYKTFDEYYYDLERRTVLTDCKTCAYYKTHKKACGCLKFKDDK